MRIVLSYTLVCLNTHTLMSGHTYTHMPGHISPYKDATYTYKDTHAPSYLQSFLPFILSAAAMFNFLRLFKHAILTVALRTLYAISSAWDPFPSTCHLAESRAAFMSWFKGHFLQTPSLVLQATWGPLATVPVVHLSSPFVTLTAFLQLFHDIRGLCLLCSQPCSRSLGSILGRCAKNSYPMNE